jgi:hypothetical protein
MEPGRECHSGQERGDCNIRKRDGRECFVAARRPDLLVPADGGTPIDLDAPGLQRHEPEHRWDEAADPSLNVVA